MRVITCTFLLLFSLQFYSQPGPRGAGKVSENECVRGMAEPVIKRDVYPNATFKVLADSITGIETTTLTSGDKLVIRNWGCENYVLTFNFETTRFAADTADLVYWIPIAGRLMTQMLSALHAPMDVKRGLVHLESYVLRDRKNNFRNLKLREEIYFTEAPIRSYVALERVWKVSSKKYGVRISFVTGPL